MDNKLNNRMKTITIKQPFAYLICSGIKDVENRTWKTNFRGRVLIHATAKFDKNFAKCEALDMFFTEEQIKQIDNYSSNVLCGSKYTDDSLHTSAIIGSVEIVDCVKNHPSIWAIQDMYHWILSNPILFVNPVKNIKGKLSFWDFNYKNYALAY
jgi:hypothetical protein